MSRFKKKASYSLPCASKQMPGPTRSTTGIIGLSMIHKRCSISCFRKIRLSPSSYDLALLLTCSPDDLSKARRWTAIFCLFGQRGAEIITQLIRNQFCNVKTDYITCKLIRKQLCNVIQRPQGIL